MPRLFITPRELDFISDLTKEVTKDIIGAKIFLYSVREDLTDVHDVYEESREKIFNPPLELEALVTWQPETVTTDRYGFESKSKSPNERKNSEKIIKFETGFSVRAKKCSTVD